MDEENKGYTLSEPAGLIIESLIDECADIKEIEKIDSNHEFDNAFAGIRSRFVTAIAEIVYRDFKPWEAQNGKV